MEHEIIVEKHFSNKTYNVSLVAWEKNGSGVVFPKEFNVSKTKAKDIKIIPEPYSSFSATSRTPVLYYKNEDRIKNIEISPKAIYTSSHE